MTKSKNTSASAKAAASEAANHAEDDARASLDQGAIATPSRAPTPSKKQKVWPFIFVNFDAKVVAN